MEKAIIIGIIVFNIVYLIGSIVAAATQYSESYDIGFAVCAWMKLTLTFLPLIVFFNILIPYMLMTQGKL